MSIQEIHISTKSKHGSIRLINIRTKFSMSTTLVLHNESRTHEEVAGRRCYFPGDDGRWDKCQRMVRNGTPYQEENGDNPKALHCMSGRRVRHKNTTRVASSIVKVER
jgi:hypothetical protein